MQKHLRILFILTIAIFSLSAIAQTAGPGGQLPKLDSAVRRKSQSPITVLLQHIGLNKSQQKSLRDFGKKANEDRKAFTKDHKGDRNAMRQYQQTERQNMEAEMQKVLTADQYAKVQSFYEESKFQQLASDVRVLRRMKLPKDTDKKIAKLKLEMRNNYALFVASNVGNETLISAEKQKDWNKYQTQLKSIMTPNEYTQYAQALGTSNGNP